MAVSSITGVKVQQTILALKFQAQQEQAVVNLVTEATQQAKAVSSASTGLVDIKV